MTQTIVFGGGCFWCTEAVFQRLRGIESVTSGYAGGHTDSPTYAGVSAGRTGHAEVIAVVFDPSVISLDQLFAVFFATHDPTTLNRQGVDVGDAYRSTIFTTSKAQLDSANAYIEKLEKEATFAKSIVTKVEPLEAFYPAEAYHQNYYNSNRAEGYCQVRIDPKIAKLRNEFTHLLESEA
jgi:peptide-methionine (S)-S-oxide reductase